MNERAKAQNRESWGDAAVSGLLAGILAGVVMAAFLVATGFAGGESVQQVLGHFDTGEGASPISGLLTHLAISGIYGIIWGYFCRIVLRLLSAPTWLVGLAYGLMLFLVAQGLFLATPSLLHGIPAPQLLIGHGVYGLMLGVQNRQSS